MQRQLVSLFHRKLCSGVQRSYSSKIKCITDKMMATKQDKSVKPKTKVNMGNMMKKDSSISDDSSVKVKEARAETVTRSQLQIQEKPSADNPAHDRVTTEKVQDKDTSESRDKKETRDGSLTRSQIPKPVDVRVTTEKVQDKDTSESRDKKETRDGSLTRSQIPKPVDVRVTTEKVQDKDTPESRDKKETRDGSLTRSQIPKPVDVRVTTEKVQDKDTSDSRDNSTKKKETRHGSLTRSQIPKPVDVRGHYLNLKLEDKRKEYRCGNRYMNLSEILTWPDYYKDFLFLNYTAKKKKVDKKNADKKNAAKSYQSGEDVAYEVNTNINSKVSLWKGDITTLEIDAIVNAANSSLLGGGGVDGAIHSSAGLDLLAECRKLDGCHQGDAKITGGYKLPAKYVIHTVGPIGRRKEEKSDMCLRKCYDSSLNLMLDNKLKSLALPCISTGIYGFPNDIACAIALHTVREFLNTHADLVDRIIFCVFLKQDVQLYEHLLPKYFPLETILPADSDTDRSKETQDSGDMKYEDLNSSNNTKHSPVPADDKSTKKSSDVSADDKSNKKSSDVSADDKSNKKSSDVFADDKSNKKSSDVFADDKSTKKRSDVSADDQPTAKYLLESEMEEHSDNEMDVDVNTEGTDDMEWTDSQTENLPGGETFSQKDKTVVENDSEKPTEKQFQETSV